jgi:hypothetical protein
MRYAEPVYRLVKLAPDKPRRTLATVKIRPLAIKLLAAGMAAVNAPRLVRR